jgi:hypothetical protein
MPACVRLTDGHGEHENGDRETRVGASLAQNRRGHLVGKKSHGAGSRSKEFAA